MARTFGLMITTVALLAGATAFSEPAARNKNADTASQRVRVRDLYPLITTPALFEARDFYVRHFGFEVAFEASWFVFLKGAGEGDAQGPSLAFMHPSHPSKPPGPESFDGKGMILTLEVADAAKVFEKLSAEKVPIVHKLSDEKWGQRRFMIRDPSGMLVDIVQQTQPAAGFWEQYPVRKK